MRSRAAVRTALRTQVHNTNSRLYQGISDPTLIYIFGSWPTLAAHQAFVSSPLREEILALQGNLTKFGWMVHIDLKRGLEELPFEAPVLAVARWKENEQVNSERATGKDMESASGFRVVDELRVDGMEGERERVLISGWKSVGAYEQYVEKEVDEDKSARECYEGVDVVLARNMEA